MIARTFALALTLAATLAGCAYPDHPPVLTPVTQPAPAATPAAVAMPARPAGERVPVILVSIDGFRADYLDRGITPNLSRLAAGGVSGPMRPSFPSKTYPNHWTIVTGLRPDRSGITANNMEDPARPGELFTMATDDPFWWSGAEPIWVTAEKAGIRSATMFWPGSVVGWGGTRGADWPNYVTGGTRPTDWQQYSQQMPAENRVRAVLDWMRRPPETRPGIALMYFDTVDTEGHQHGPMSAEVNAAIAETDRAIGQLVEGLAALHQPANLIVLADHGMAATSSERVVALDTLVPATDARIVESGPYATFVPLPGREAALAAILLKPHDHFTCWRKADIPARLHYGRNVRVPPFLCLADDGWMLSKTAPTKPFSRGEHGYDNALPDMRALFVANGPAFARGRKIPAFDNVAVAPLLRDLLGLPPGAGLDGDDRPFRGVMTR